jgi:hypothetical protein
MWNECDGAEAGDGLWICNLWVVSSRRTCVRIRDKQFSRPSPVHPPQCCYGGQAGRGRSFRRIFVIGVFAEWRQGTGHRTKSGVPRKRSGLPPHSTTQARNEGADFNLAAAPIANFFACHAAFGLPLQGVTICSLVPRALPSAKMVKAFGLNLPPRANPGLLIGRNGRR